jgi:hypothetical protein
VYVGLRVYMGVTVGEEPLPSAWTDKRLRITACIFSSFRILEGEGRNRFGLNFCTT